MNNKTVLRRYTIEGVEPALLKSPKLLGKGNLNLSALINKLAEAEGQEPETYETWIGEPSGTRNLRNMDRGTVRQLSSVLR